MVRHGPSAVVALVLVLLGSALQFRARRQVADEQAPLPVSATVVNVVAPVAVLFISGAVAYLRVVGLAQGGNARVTTVLIAAALLACAGKIKTKLMQLESGKSGRFCASTSS